LLFLAAEGKNLCRFIRKNKHATAGQAKGCVAECKRPFFSFGHATARMRDLFGGEKGTFNIALFFSSAFFFTSKNLPQPMLVQVFLQTEADVLLLSAAITPAKTIRSAYRRCCKRVSLPDQKDNLSGNFVYSPHLPDHGNAAFARLSSVWPEAYKVTSGHSSR
ncbi:MAG: hypothetical protein ACLR94_12035, partial [Acutalibacteraceae bacterium]